MTATAVRSDSEAAAAVGRRRAAAGVRRRVAAARAAVVDRVSVAGRAVVGGFAGLGTVLEGRGALLAVRSHTGVDVGRAAAGGVRCAGRGCRNVPRRTRCAAAEERRTAEEPVVVTCGSRTLVVASEEITDEVTGGTDVAGLLLERTEEVVRGDQADDREGQQADLPVGEDTDDDAEQNGQRAEAHGEGHEFGCSSESTEEAGSCVTHHEPLSRVHAI